MLTLSPQAISTHYASSDCEYINVAGTTQEVVSKEVQEVIKKRLGNSTNQSFSLDVSCTCEVLCVYL